MKKRIEFTTGRLEEAESQCEKDKKSIIEVKKTNYFENDICFIISVFVNTLQFVFKYQYTNVFHYFLFKAKAIISQSNTTASEAKEIVDKVLKDIEDIKNELSNLVDVGKCD